MYTWEEAKQRLAKTRFGHLRIENNTWLEANNGNYIIRHHNTDIITITPENHYIIHCRGYRSNSTKKRLNGYSPARIFCRNFTWYVEANNQTILYEDGMRFDLDGKLLGSKYKNVG